MAERRLCVLTTHPIQYMAPWFRRLATEPGLALTVLFLRELDPARQGVGFGHAFLWDVPLREGYTSEVLGAAPGLRGIPAALRRLWAALRRLRPDAVLITGWNEPALIAAYPLVRALGMPILVRGESNDLRPRGVLQRCLHRWLLGQASGVLAIGSANRRFCLASGVPPGRIYPGAYFVDADRMLAQAGRHGGERERERQRHGFGPEEFVFVFVGKHVPFKRPQLLLEAAARLRTRGLPAAVLYAGSGELTPQLERLACEVGVPTGFTGFLNQSELWKAYVPADAFVLPSTSRETWGLVTNEAMLFGLPVIVSREAGCCEDLVVEGKTGYSFAGGSEHLAAAMERLMEKRGEAQEIGRHARDHVLGVAAEEQATEGLRQALTSLERNRTSVT